jgi:hypothetical protein
MSPSSTSARHGSGNWGDLYPEDQRANREALRTCARLLNAYHAKASRCRSSSRPPRMHVGLAWPASASASSTWASDMAGGTSAPTCQRGGSGLPCSCRLPSSLRVLVPGPHSLTYRRLLRTSTRLQETREVPAPADLLDRQLDLPGCVSPTSEPVPLRGVNHSGARSPRAAR